MSGNGFYNPGKEAYLASSYSMPSGNSSDYDGPTREESASSIHKTIEEGGGNSKDYPKTYTIDIDCPCKPDSEPYIQVQIPIDPEEEESEICEGPDIVGFSIDKIITYLKTPCPKCGADLDKAEVEDLLTYYWEG